MSAAVFAVACSARSTRDTKELRVPRSAARGETVAIINGDAIGIEDVRRVVHETGLSPRSALRRLEARTLLIQEAARRRVSVNPSDERRVRQALVQALLIKEIEAEPVAEASIRAAFEAQALRFSTPERRASAHVLAVVKPSDGTEVRAAAQAFAEQMISRLREKTFSQVAEQALRLGEGQSFEVKVEQVPPVSKDGPLVQPYMEALFAATGVGVVDEPVETKFGWHAVLVTEILPATTQAYSDVRDTLRSELVLAQRKLAVDAILKESKERALVAVHKAVIPEFVRIEP